MIYKSPKKKTYKEICSFFNNIGLSLLVKEANTKDKAKNTVSTSITHKPDLTDLYRLYQFIIINKRTTILELGSGWSTLIFFIAMNSLKNKFGKDVKKLRRNNPFEIFVLENSKKYLDITKKRINFFKKKLNLKNCPKVNYSFSNVDMELYENKICTSFKKLPMCNPDFIYLDGPDQFNVKKDVNGISTRHLDMMPMSSDILKFEFFYTPGTLIICDGRSANALFLKSFLKRNWHHKYDQVNDQHIFYLKDPSLGKYNDLQLAFYKK
jgi:hypothetical protein